LKQTCQSVAKTYHIGIYHCSNLTRFASAEQNWQRKREKEKRKKEKTKKV